MPDANQANSSGIVANVRVSLALLAVRNSDVVVAVTNHGRASLPWSAPDRGTALDGLARTMLNQATGSEQGYLEQLYTFSFERQNVAEIMVSYLGLAPFGASLSSDLTWLMTDEMGALPPDDRVVVDYALIRLRAKIGYSTIAFHLMPESFSLSDLQQMYESILARPLDPRNFRRRMVSSGLLQPENRLRREGSHRPAALYRFSGSHDPGSFLTPPADRLQEDND